MRTFRQSALAVAVITTAGFGVLFSFFQAHSTISRLVEESAKTSTAIVQMEAELLRTERATIGYMLSRTVNTESSVLWLQMKGESVTRLKMLLGELLVDFSGSGIQKRRFMNLKDLVGERLTVLDRYSQMNPGQQQRPSNVSPQRGFEVSNQIRVIVNGILETERTLIERRAQIVRATYAGFMTVLVIVSIAFIMFARRTYTKLAHDILIEKGLRIDLQLLLRELHHRVKNSLQTVSSVLRLQEIRSTEPGAAAASSSAQTRVQAIARVHQSLYELQKLELPALDYVTKLLDEIEGTASMTIMRCLEPVTLSLDAAVPLSLILNELVTNAVKYGGRNPRISVALHPHEEMPGHFVLRVSDNGGGYPEEFNPLRAKSLGYSIIRALSIQLAAVETKYTNEPGATFYMVAPNTQHTVG